MPIIRTTPKGMSNFISWSITFVFVVVAWVFFRSEDISQAFAMLQNMMDIRNIIFPQGLESIKMLGLIGEFGVSMPNFIDHTIKIDFPNKKSLVLILIRISLI